MIFWISLECNNTIQTVRTAFNVAIGAESDQIKRTARNALLQMLNTVVKRVTQFPLVSPDSLAVSDVIIICNLHSLLYHRVSEVLADLIEHFTSMAGHSPIN